MLGRGDTLAGYRIDDVIGMGGMAIVYRAEQVSLGRAVALKVLSPQLSRDEEFRERFRREGKHAAALHHPNVVTIFDSGEADGRLFLAMLLVEGTTLAEKMSSERLSADETLSVLAPIASALDAAHALGLVHRDVKPQNILLDRGARPYLADFGIAKGSAATAGLTATGGFVGSLNYAAPEQIRGEPATAATDVYALAAVLYQCLTGQVPYPRDTDASVMYAQLHEPPPRLPNRWPQAGELSNVIARGLAKQPSDRYPEAGQLMEDAAALIAGMPGSLHAASPPFPMTQTSGHGSATGADPRSATSYMAGIDPTAVQPARRPRDHETATSPRASARSARVLPPNAGDQTTADRRRETAGPPPPDDGSPSRRWVWAVAAAVFVIAAAAAAVVVLERPKSSPSRLTGNSTHGATSPTAGRGATAKTGVTRPNGTAGTTTTTSSTTTTTSKSTTTSSTTSSVSRSRGVGSTTANSSPTLLGLANSPSASYSILVPTIWSYHSVASTLDSTTDLWVGSNPLEKMQIVVSSCVPCASNDGQPNPRGPGLPPDTVGSFSSNPWFVGYEATTTGDPYPDNGLLVVTSQGSTPTGYAEVDLWLPDGLHSTATRILDSFSLFQTALGPHG